MYLANIEDLKANGNDVVSKKEELPEFHPHPHYPALSNVIKIEYTKRRGRYGVAARDIQVRIYIVPIFLFNTSLTMNIESHLI